MFIRDIRLSSVDFVDPHTMGSGQTPRVIFEVQTSEQSFPVPVLLDTVTEDTEIVREAQAKLHQTLLALLEKTKDWARP